MMRDLKENRDGRKGGRVRPISKGEKREKGLAAEKNEICRENKDRLILFKYHFTGLRVVR